jgi:3-ketoacyl-CoA synthase
MGDMSDFRSARLPKQERDVWMHQPGTAFPKKPTDPNPDSPAYNPNRAKKTKRTKPVEAHSTSFWGGDYPTRDYWWPERAPEIKHVRRGLLSTAWVDQNLFLFVLPVLAAAAIVSLSQIDSAVVLEGMRRMYSGIDTWNFTFLMVGVTSGLAVFIVYLVRKPFPVYLIDYAVYYGRDDNKVIPHEFIYRSRMAGFFTDESMDFQEKLLFRTGLGPETYFPPGICESPPRTDMAAAREEAEHVMFGCIDELFEHTGTNPKDIDILVVNCSLFCPTPSLAAMIINKYRLRSNIKAYNLGGMGCSAGLLSIDLAKDMLQVYRGALALVMSMENITQNWYLGDNRSMLVSNTLFRVGGAAILLTSSRAARWRAKYAMKASVRVHAAQDDQAYRAVFQCDDGAGRVGVALSKELLTSVGGALKANMTRLGPQVLPYSEQLKFFASYCYRRWIQPKHKQYVPDFSKAFEHYCIHAGGRAIIDGLQQNLKLSDRDVEPSRATLYRYGNTSSSSVWYELNYIEKAGRLRSGDRVWQIAVGSGIKCNSVVWQSLKTMRRVSGGEDEEE